MTRDAGGVEENLLSLLRGHGQLDVEDVRQKTKTSREMF
jgi:hypothetical protein